MHAKELATQIEEYRRRDIDAPTHYREYFNRKRELQNLYLVRDRLQLRLIEEKIDAAVPRKAKDFKGFDFVPNPTIP
jgi:hypothetical protein